MATKSDKDTLQNKADKDAHRPESASTEDSAAPAVEPSKPEEEELDDLIRALRKQGAEIIFPGKRLDGSPRKF